VSASKDQASLAISYVKWPGSKDSEWLSTSQLRVGEHLCISKDESTGGSAMGPEESQTSLRVHMRICICMHICE